MALQKLLPIRVMLQIPLASSQEQINTTKITWCAFINPENTFFLSVFSDGLMLTGLGKKEK